MNVFECDKCGLCCIGINKHELTKDLHNGDGICKNLDQDTMLCRIYEERPVFCDVEKYYDQYLKDKMGKEEFLRLNALGCEVKKKEWEECGRDIRKMTSRIPEMDERQEKLLYDSIEEAVEAL